MEIPPEQDIVTSDDEVPTGIYVTSLPQGFLSKLICTFVLFRFKIEKKPSIR